MFQTRSVVRLAEEERKNLDHSIELLSGTYDLVTELEALYDFMPQRCQFPEDTNKNDATLAGRVNAHLIFMCRREFDTRHVDVASRVPWGSPLSSSEGH